MHRAFSALFVLSIFALPAVACSDNGDGGDYVSYGGGGTAGGFCASYTTCGACTPVEGCGWCASADGTGTCASGPDACVGDTFRWNWDPVDCPVPSADGGVRETGTPSTDAAIGVTTDGSTSDETSSDAAGETILVDAVTSEIGAEVATDASSDETIVTSDAATDETSDASTGDDAATDETSLTSDAATDETSLSTDAGAVDAATNEAGNEASFCPAADPTQFDGCVQTTGGTLCASSDFTLACHASGGSTTPPTPSSTLGCTLQPIPTPAGSAYYCCPCGG